MIKVLVVEDDPPMAVALRDGFQYEGHFVKLEKDGEAALKAVSESRFDIVILDVMLPKLSGFDVCKAIRQSGSKVPIILLTARAQEIDKVIGLRLGADDYVTKPFSFMELMARVEAVLRRSCDHFSLLETYEFGDVRVDFKRSLVFKKGKKLRLTAREFNLLKYFIEHRGEVLTRDQLLNAVWGYNSAPFTRTVDTHVAKLRQKVEDPNREPQYVLTVHRVGYRFNG